MSWQLWCVYKGNCNHIKLVNMSGYATQWIYFYYVDIVLHFFTLILFFSTHVVTNNKILQNSIYFITENSFMHTQYQIPPIVALYVP